MAQQNEQTQVHQKAIEDSELKLKAVFDSSTDIHVLVNRDMEVIAYNRPAHNYISSIYNHDH